MTCETFHEFCSHAFPVVMDNSVSTAAVVLWIYTIAAWYFSEKLSYSYVSQITEVNISVFATSTMIKDFKTVERIKSYALVEFDWPW